MVSGTMTLVPEAPERLVATVGLATRISFTTELGGVTAIDRLWPLVRQALRSLVAQGPSHERPGGTLPATTWVQEAYIRLVRSAGGGRPRRRYFAPVTALV